MLRQLFGPPFEPKSKMATFVTIQIDPTPPKAAKGDEVVNCLLCTTQAVPGSQRCKKHTDRCISCSGSVSRDVYAQCKHCWQTARPTVKLPRTSSYTVQNALEQGFLNSITPPTTPTKEFVAIGFHQEAFVSEAGKR